MSSPDTVVKFHKLGVRRADHVRYIPEYPALLEISGRERLSSRSDLIRQTADVF
jgi:hypothetical protein